MMPSRGWHAARSSSLRLFQLQCRNISSASTRIPQAPSRPLNPTPLLRRRQWANALPSLSAASLAIRHASTIREAAQDASPAAAPPPAAAAAEPSSFPNLDTITLDNIDLDTTADIANIPEKIGYLHEIGLNYGWGPTSLLEWILEHIHIYAGLPWWASIGATAVAIRIVMFPLYLKSSDVMARQSALVPVTKPITDRMTACQKAGDQEGMMRAWTELSNVRKRAGISFRDQFTPMIIQGVLAYCGFKLMRAMVALPVPAFKTDGFLWLQDLTLSDPYLLLPAAMAASIHFLVRMGGESGAANNQMMNPGMQKFMLWGLPGLAFMFTGWQAGAICIWFASGGFIGISQALLLQRPAVRKFFGIAPLYKPKKSEGAPPSPFMDIIESAKTRAASRNEPSKTRPPIDVASAGKNTAYMAPKYQSPNLQRNVSSQVLDVKATSKPQAAQAKDSDMVQPNASPKPSSGGFMAKFNELRQNAKEQAKEKEAKRRSDLARRREDKYEQEAQKRKGGRKGR